MKKTLIFLGILFAFSDALAAYTYSYVPQSFSPTIYNFVYRKREKCKIGERYDYPKQIGVCATCPDGTAYLIDETKSKAACFKCPDGTLLVSRNGYPMCLSQNAVVNGTAQKPNGTAVTAEELERLSLGLSADYKSTFDVKTTDEKNYLNRPKLLNVCPSLYPDGDNDDVRRKIELCRRLKKQNDFLCPYVEKDEAGKWVCRACPKNAPYKNKSGGCFTCPYGEEMVAQDDGRLVCASQAEPKKKKPAVKKAPAKKSLRK